MPKTIVPMYITTTAYTCRQSVGKGCQKSYCPWAMRLSKVETVFNHGFEAIYPLQHSGVVRASATPRISTFHSYRIR
jgi:hypothetical protein